MKLKTHLILLLLIGCLCACSTKKNTALTRSFHQMQTKYNIFHNGAISYLEGEQAIIEANKDDFSSILPLACGVADSSCILQSISKPF